MTHYAVKETLPRQCPDNDIHATDNLGEVFALFLQILSTIFHSME